jgi:tetratricopeptide (TPR) repeat protein
MRTVVFRGGRAFGVLMMLALVAPAPAADPLTPSQVYQHTLRGTVWIHTDKGMGSGWLCDQDGKLLVTNHHVVGDSDTVTVFFPAYRDGKPIPERDHYRDKERPFRGRVIDTDPGRDLAVIQLDALPEDARALALAADSPGPSDRIHAIGNPRTSAGLWAYTAGTVRGVCLTKKVLDEGQQLHCRVIETDSPVNPGDSGGPVADRDGRLVGVTSAHNPDGRLVSYCIDVTEVRTYLAEVRDLMHPRTAADFARRGQQLLRRKQYDQALAALTNAIRLDPNRAEYFAHRGDVFAGRQDWDSALGDYAEAIRLDRRCAPAHSGRGAVHHDTGKYDEAIKDCTTAIRLDPSCTTAYYHRGSAYYFKKELDRAVADYTKAIELGPARALYFNDRAVAYNGQGNYDRAVDDYVRAIELDPTCALVYSNLGFAAVNKGDYDLAVKACGRALEIDPKLLCAYRNRGLAFQKKGDHARAVAHYTAALEIDKDYADGYYFRATVYEEQDELERADADYARALALDADNAKWVKREYQRHLRVENSTGEPIRVYVQYDMLGQDGKWYWVPADGNPLHIDLAAGETTRLAHRDVPVSARRVRIWADGLRTGARWQKGKGQDVWLAPQTGYHARQRMTATYTFER